MFNQDSNSAYYKIKLTGIDEKAIQVVSFEGEEKISGLFEYRVEIISQDINLDSSGILNHPASFTFVRGDETPETIFGIISNFEYYGRTKLYAHYRVVLVPQLWRMNLIFQNQVYQKMNIKDLIEQIFNDSKMSSNDYRTEIDNWYPKMDYIVQYKESNFSFLNRRLEHLGIFYCIDFSKGTDKILFTDDNKMLPKINHSENVEFNENRANFGDTETIIDLNCREQVVTGSVKLKDYNYMFPDNQLMGDSKITSMPGLYYDFGDNFENSNIGTNLAKVRDQEFICQSRVFSGICDSRLFRAGRRFKLQDHFRSDWNAEYIITSTSVTGSQPGLAGYLNKPENNIHFECKFTAIPMDHDFRPPRNTPIPKISGIMSAKIDSGASDDYAFIDDDGRYKAKMLFDLSSKHDGEATMPIRMVQSYSGPGYGIHFPNHKGTELLWACVDGDVDRPIGLGTVPNPSQASPVVSKNKMQNIIRTAAGNEFLIDDKKDETQIALTTKDQNKILLDDKDDKIEVTTKNKHIMTFDDKNENITLKSKDGHLMVMDDKNKKIEVQSKNGHIISIDDNDDKEKLTLVDKSGDNTIVIDISNKKITIKTAKGGIDMEAPDGKIQIKAKELDIETKGDTKLKAANINSEAKGNYEIKASNVTEEATANLKMKGMNIEAKSDVSTKIEGGATLEAKGGVEATFEGGAVANFKGGAEASLKAGIVMIN